jgi:two-component system chemotaxis sensor kinase CheA
VLDVASGGDLAEAGTNKRASGLTLLNNRVTGVVDLGGVAALPSAGAPEAWNQALESVR